MRPKRRLGQHFLTNRRILDRIVEALDLAPGDAVLEIGPGRGALTERLLAHGARVTAIEKDEDLLPVLRGTVPGARIAHADALRADWAALAEVEPGVLRVAGNIPYNITSPLIEKALTPPRPARIVFLVQKEVADRVVATPGGKVYGALTVGVQAVARAERLFTVPAGAFVPPPAVDSALLRLTPREDPLIRREAVPAFRQLVVALFAMRRKQLQRGLRQLTGQGGEAVDALLLRLGFDPAQRPETLSPEDFARLHRALVDGGWWKG